MSLLLIAILHSSEYELKGKGVAEAEQLAKDYVKNETEEIEGKTIEGFDVFEKKTKKKVLKNIALIVGVKGWIFNFKRNVKIIPVVPDEIVDDDLYHIAVSLLRSKLQDVVNEIQDAKSFLPVGANYDYICDLTPRAQGMQVWSSGRLGLWVGQSNYYKPVLLRACYLEEMIAFFFSNTTPKGFKRATFQVLMDGFPKEGDEKDVLAEFVDVDVSLYGSWLQGFINYKETLNDRDLQHGIVVTVRDQPFANRYVQKIYSKSNIKSARTRFVESSVAQFFKLFVPYILQFMMIDYDTVNRQRRVSVGDFLSDVNIRNEYYNSKWPSQIAAFNRQLWAMKDKYYSQISGVVGKGYRGLKPGTHVSS